jgi:hypothetical protein
MFRSHLFAALVATLAITPVVPTRATPDASMPASAARRAPKNWCGTYPNRARDARIAHDAHAAALASKGKRAGAAAVVTDVGDLAVVQDDGTIVVQPNDFDITKGTKVVLTPVNGQSFTIASGGAKFIKGGDRVTGFVGDGPGTPDDDGYKEVPFAGGFRFPFYGATYDRVFVGTNGFVTFESGDFNSPAVVSAAALELDEPRIAAFWADLDTTNSSVLVKQSANVVSVTWKGVQKFSDAGSTGSNTFQIQLHSDGRVALVYKKMTDQAELIGVAPGRGVARPANVNFRNPGSAAVAAPIERFADAISVDSQALTSAFYREHGDDYDFVYTWTDFPTDLGNAFAFYLPITNEVAGIGQQLTDDSGSYGSDGRLRGLLNLNRPDLYPDDPTEQFLGQNSALAIFGQEQGHRWLAYVRFRGSNALLGRQTAHWSPYFNTESTLSSSAERHSSCAEGNSIVENGNGTFSTNQRSIDYFSALDLYLMGLRGADEVPDSFLVANGTGSPSTSPQFGLTLRGNRQRVTIDDIVESNGPRVPDVSASQKEFRAAWILLVRQGTSPSQQTLDKLELFRSRWEEYFNIAVEGRGRLSCELVSPARR